jgi:hypothetical protein
MWGVELVEGKDRPRQRGALKYEGNGGATCGLLLRMLEPIFSKGHVVILDSGFCVLKGIVELKKHGVYASALIKKRRYWPKHIRGDEIKEHFIENEVGDADAWRGKLDNVNFHVYCMKEPDYVMSLMSTYGTNSRVGCKETKRDWVQGGVKKTKQFAYPEVVDNHFKFRHAVDDHNNRRHSPICLESVWSTKWWPNRVFAFLFAVTEVNVNLADHYFYNRDTPITPQLDFRRQLANELIHNHHFVEEPQVSPCTRRRREAEQGHDHKSLPTYKKFKGAEIVAAKCEYPLHKCSQCTKRCRHYCSCSPGTYICSACFPYHFAAFTTQLSP